MPNLQSRRLDSWDRQMVKNVWQGEGQGVASVDVPPPQQAPSLVTPRGLAMPWILTWNSPLFPPTWKRQINPSTKVTIVWTVTTLPLEVSLLDRWSWRLSNPAGMRYMGEWSPQGCVCQSLLSRGYSGSSSRQNKHAYNGVIFGLLLWNVLLLVIYAEEEGVGVFPPSLVQCKWIEPYVIKLCLLLSSPSQRRKKLKQADFYVSWHHSP